MKQPLGVILAGGLATRMGGGDKGLLPLGEGTLLSHVIDRLAPQVAGLALNANGDPARFADLHLPVVADSIEGYAGPLAGVLAGLDWAAAQGGALLDWELVNQLGQLFKRQAKIFPATVFPGHSSSRPSSLLRRWGNRITSRMLG